MSIAILRNLKSDAHSRRVTLNLARHANCTPPDLRSALQSAHDHEYQLSALTNAEAQTIYAAMDSEFVSRVIGEFEVDTSTVRDWVFPYRNVAYNGSFVRTDAHPWWHGENEVDCKLCGHQHNRFEFLARNRAGGEDVWMGSTCIVKFKFRVDGEGVAEAALERMREIIAGLKRSQFRYNWTVEHQTDYRAAIDVITGITLKHSVSADLPQQALWSELDGRCPREYWRRFPRDLSERVHNVRVKARAIRRYFVQHGMLTKKRTLDIWQPVKELDDNGKAIVVGWKSLKDSPGPLMAEIRDIQGHIDLVNSGGNARFGYGPEAKNQCEAIHEFWVEFKAKHVHMNSYHERQVDLWHQDLMDPDTEIIGSHYWKRVFDEIKIMHERREVALNEPAPDLPF